VRDVFHINGKIVLDHCAQPLLIVLNQAHPLAKELCRGLASSLAREQAVIILGEI